MPSNFKYTYSKIDESMCNLTIKRKVMVHFGYYLYFFIKAGSFKTRTSFMKNQEKYTKCTKRLVGLACIKHMHKDFALMVCLF